jgi:hemolysin III
MARVKSFFAFVPMANLPEWIDNGEETANWLTHVPGVLGSAAALVILVISAVRARDVYRIVSYVSFGLSLLNLYTFSTLYHFVTTEKYKRVLRYGDHVSIYFLIAGTYTPFTLVTLRNGSGWIIFGIVWGIAAVGTVLKILKFDGFFKFTVLSFIGMGWVIVFAMKDLIGSLEIKGLYWMVFGGLMYTFGTFFFSRDEQVPYYHAIWHLYVLAGSLTHFLAVIWYS